MTVTFPRWREHRTNTFGNTFPDAHEGCAPMVPPAHGAADRMHDRALHFASSRRDSYLTQSRSSRPVCPRLADSFSPEVLEQTRVIRATIPNPRFYPLLKLMGIDGVLELSSIGASRLLDRVAYPDRCQAGETHGFRHGYRCLGESKATQNHVWRHKPWFANASARPRSTTDRGSTTSPEKSRPCGPAPVSTRTNHHGFLKRNRSPPFRTSSDSAG